MSTLFISHSSRDAGEAAKIKTFLEARKHESVFLDFDEEKGIVAGESWERTLYNKLRACRAVIALCTDHYLESKWCFAEIALARMEGKSIFALQVDPWGEATKLPSILTADQFIDLRKDREKGLGRLEEGLRAKGIVPSEHRSWRPDRSPYPGLRAFDEADAPIFFGREDETLRGIELLNGVRRQGHPRLVVVLGASGSGKSSLARAGIIPRLRRDRDSWLVVGPLRPGREPLRRMAGAVEQAFARYEAGAPPAELLGALDPDRQPPAAAAPGTPGSATESPARRLLLDALRDFAAEGGQATPDLLGPLETLQHRLAAPTAPQATGAAPRPTGDALGDLLSTLRHRAGSPEAGVVLVVDQFEELLWRQGQEESPPSERCLGVLRDSLGRRDGPLIVLATMRSDYLDALQTSPTFHSVAFKPLSVGPMSDEGITQIIEEPARLGRISLGKGLADRLRKDTGTSDALPLLAFALRRLWERFHDRGILETRDYLELGGLEGAIAQVADETLEAALADGREPVLRDAFLQLARFDRTSSRWLRQPVPREEFDDAARAMLERFVNVHLLLEREGALEVAHEALFHSWHRLRDWLSANAEGIRLRDEIQTGAERWDSARSDSDKEPYLWRGGRLARALELRDRGTLKLTDRDLLFVEASQRAEQARRDEKEAQLQRELEQARLLEESFAASLFEQGRGELLFGNPLKASIYLSESYSIRPTSVPLRMLLAWSLRQLPYATLHGHRDVLRAGGFDPTGRRVITAGDDRTARIWDAASGDLLIELKGHAGKVRSAAFAAAGERVVTASDDRTARVWEAHSGELIALLEGHEAEIALARFGPTGRRVVTASADDTARLWSALSGELLAVLPGHAADVTDAEFDATGTRVVTASADHIARVWEIPTGKLLATLQGHSAALNSARFDLTGKRVVTASYDRTARIWQSDSGEPIATLDGHEAQVLEACFDVTGDRLVTASEDGTARIWDAGGTALSHLSGHAGRVVSAAFDLSGVRVVTASHDGTARVWDVESGTLLAALEGHAAAITSTTFDAAGSRVLTTSADRTARLWEVSAVALSRPLTGHGDWVTSVAFDAPGEHLVTASLDRTARIWKVASGEPLAVLEGHEEALNWAAFDVEGERVVTAGSDGDARLWHAPSGRLLCVLAGHGSSVNVAAFGAGGRIVTGSDDATARLWDLSGNRLATLEGHTGSVVSAAFDTGGARLVTASHDRTARIWDAESGRPLALLEGHGDAVVAAAFAGDGERVATAGKDQTGGVWEAATGKRLATLAGHEAWLRSIAFDPTGRRLVTASLDRTARVWDAASGDLLASLEGHVDAVNSAAFDPAGERIVTASDDGTARVWDAATGALIATLDDHTAGVVSALFDGGGGRIATASADGTARVWTLPLETRSPQEIAALVAAHVPYRLVRGRVVPRQP